MHKDYKIYQSQKLQCNLQTQTYIVRLTPKQRCVVITDDVVLRHCLAATRSPNFYLDAKFSLNYCHKIRVNQVLCGDFARLGLRLKRCDKYTRNNCVRLLPSSAAVITVTKALFECLLTTQIFESKMSA